MLYWKYVGFIPHALTSKVLFEKEKAIELMEPHDFTFADLIFRPPGVLMTGTGFEAVIVLLYSFAPVTRIMGILRQIRDREAGHTWLAVVLPETEH